MDKVKELEYKLEIVELKLKIAELENKIQGMQPIPFIPYYHQPIAEDFIVTCNSTDKDNCILNSACGCNK